MVEAPGPPAAPHAFTLANKDNTTALAGRSRDGNDEVFWVFMVYAG
ncbi:hypothetical protein CBM2599_B50864 [Cupriavidus taiwanensis]|nr:hypothetical protein CBM2599_B50864 [Cupriavidus taiwanensis]